MKNSHIVPALIVGATVLIATAWISSAGPLTPPAGPVAGTGVTTQQLADLISGGDPCQCEGLRQAAISTASNSTLLSTAQNYYVKRVTFTKSVSTAEVYFQLREPSSTVIGFYRLRPDEGSMVAEIDMVLKGLQLQNLLVSSGSLQITTTYKPVP